MAKYLLIESRDPFENNIVARQYDLAANLVKEGNEVTLFLVQNGVFPARPSDRSALLTNAARGGVEVLAEEFSLRERGISAGKLAEGVRAAPLSVVIDHLAQGCKAIWH
jgi:sulfur relay (sulfurtransferase) complex TusBCD TusD component (DsrE family)